MSFVNYVEKVTGVSIYGLTSLVLFGLFFTIITIWAFRADKKMIEEVKNIPLNANA